MERVGLAAGVAALVVALATIASAQAGFNDDFYADLAVGAAAADVSGQQDAGLVLEIRGGAAGVTTEDVPWHQDAGLLDSCEYMDQFGEVLAIGDFNGDGFADLAVGIPFEDILVDGKEGMVQVIYGSSTGLTATGNQLFDQENANIITTAEAGDSFGRALAVGDFNRDGFDDLAVGTPNEGVGTEGDAGEVVVIHGSSAGLTPIGSEWILQSSYERGNHFGHALAAGDIDGDGFDDLVIGAPGTEIESVPEAGVIEVLYGTQTWLERRTSYSEWHHAAFEEGGHFGSTLVTGDFNGDGHDDVAVGAVDKDVDGVVDAGMIDVAYGVDGGLTGTGAQSFNQDSFGDNLCETNDHFGSSLAAGDFNGDGYDDLAVGTPDEDWGSLTNAGMVQVFSGWSTGLSGGESITQDSLSQGAIEQGDRFGFALAAGDIDHDGFSDLAFGTPNEDRAAIQDAGAVFITYGSTSGLDVANDDLIDPCTSGYSLSCVQNTWFGYSVAITPKLDTLFKDDFESAGTSRWSSALP